MVWLSCSDATLPRQEQAAIQIHLFAARALMVGLKAQAGELDALNQAHLRSSCACTQRC